jgi:hypothetical protein
LDARQLAGNPNVGQYGRGSASCPPIPAL